MANGSRGNRDDDFDDDRPSRRRPREEFDNDPGYSSRPMPRAKGVNVMGVIALILGIVGLIISLIPCFGIIGIPLTAIGLLLGLIGIFTSGTTTGRGLPIAGTSVSLIGLLIGIAWIAMAGMWVKQVGDQVKEIQVESEKQVQIAIENQAKLEKEMREGKAVVVLANKLDEEYDANLIGADTKYKGKVLELTGKVKRVDRDRFGKPWIEFETESDAVMKCEFPKESDAPLGKVEVNKNLTIRGLCKGKIKGREGDEIVLENCLIVTPPAKGK